MENLLQNPRFVIPEAVVGNPLLLKTTTWIPDSSAKTTVNAGACIDKRSEQYNRQGGAAK
jgi:hypothetical protein